MNATYRIRLLGHPQVEKGNAPLRGFESRKSLALLGYLVRQTQPVPRIHLADLFWGDLPEARGRRNLSHEMSLLSHLLPHCFESDYHAIQFKPSPAYWVDTVAFMELVKPQVGDPSFTQAPSEAQIGKLVEATELYRDDFMAGLYLDDCPEFEIWLVREQEFWRQRFTSLLECLGLYYTIYRPSPKAQTFLERWLEVEPWREEAHCQLMRLLALHGERSAALAQYQRACQMLAQDLNAEPMAETVALYELIRAGALGGGEKISPTPASAHLPPRLPPPLFLSTGAPSAAPLTAFVGRERALGRLNEILAAALAGRGRIALINGEAGSGKTLLARGFARRAQESYPDLVVAWGSSDAQTGLGDPYLPFREILKLLAGEVEAQWKGGMITCEDATRLWDLQTISAPALVKRGPDLIDSFVPGIALLRRASAFAPDEADWLVQLRQQLALQAEPGSGTPVDQSHIFEQYADVLQAIATERPLLLILDDLHWADRSSISLLFHLSRRLEASRILIVGSYRPEDVAQGWDGQPHPLSSVLSEFKRLFGGIWIDLDRAAAVEGRRFVDALLDREPNRLGEAFREALFRQTEGHALFTTELLRDMQERGDLEKDKDKRWIESATLDWERLPTRVEGVIEKRINRLSPEWQHALRVASVEGESFTAEVVARVQALNKKQLVRRLSGELDRQHRLVSAQSLDWLGSQRLSRYRFRHNLFQKYLYSSLDEVERGYLHEQVGQALEALYGDQTEQVAVRLARHFQAAGNVSKAVDCLLQAGEHARRLSANEEAISHFNLGLALLETLPDTRERARRELAGQIPLGNALIASKGHTAPEVVRAFSRAQELCRRMESMPELWTVLHGLYRYFLSVGRVQTARELAEQLLDLAQNRSDPVQLLTAHEEVALTYFFRGEFALALAHLDKSLEFYDPQLYAIHDQLGEDIGVTALCYSAVAAWFLGYPDQALNRGRRALSIAQALPHPYSLAAALIYLALFHQFRREGQVVQERAEAAIDLSIENHFPFRLASGRILRGWALAEQGQVAEGILQVRQGVSDWHALGSEVGHHYFLALLADAYRKAGQAEEGLGVIAEALSTMSDIGGLVEAELYRLKGELLWTRGVGRAEVEAEESFQQALEIARRQGAKSLALRAVMDLSRLWQRQGKREAARRVLEEIYAGFSEGFETADLKEARALLEVLRR